MCKKVTGQHAQGCDWGLFLPHCLSKIHFCHALWPHLAMILWMQMSYTLSVPLSIKVSCDVWWDSKNSYTQHLHLLACSHYLVDFRAIKFSSVEFYSYCQLTLQNRNNNLQSTVQREELMMRHHPGSISQFLWSFWGLGEFSESHRGLHMHSNWEVKPLGVHSPASGI